MTTWRGRKWRVGSDHLEFSNQHDASVWPEEFCLPVPHGPRELRTDGDSLLVVANDGSEYRVIGVDALTFDLCQEVRA